MSVLNHDAVFRRVEGWRGEVSFIPGVSVSQVGEVMVAAGSVGFLGSEG